ncbi:MAG: hypothetical protein WBL32_10920 [Acetivibrionales bacterium]|jgi:hypothetical protein|nr:hypothetical protein [Bacillota bacterium]HOA55664.1 hypothetical protein [Clostridiales bacterium]HPZ05442.1 hypothetical protein [Clostridiales bacterium]HQD30256.1 hypothetical protein [Clostridiales bacterium]
MTTQIVFLLVMIALIGVGIVAMNISIKKHNARMAATKKKRLRK